MDKEREAIHKLNLKKANTIYQMKPKYKEYRKKLRRDQTLERIEDYIIEHCHVEHMHSLKNNFSNMKDIAEMKKEFVNLFSKEDYLKYITLR